MRVLLVEDHLDTQRMLARLQQLDEVLDEHQPRPLGLLGRFVGGTGKRERLQDWQGIFHKIKTLRTGFEV